MTNEEFQMLVLEKLTGLEQGQKSLGKRMDSLEKSVDSLEQEVRGIKKTVNEISERTADLFEFKTETNKKVNELIEDSKSTHEILGEHEVSIRTLRRRAV